MPNASLEIGSKRYVGWEEISISSSIESLAESFSLGVAANLDIEPEDACQVKIDGQLILTGAVERVIPSFDGDTDDFAAMGFSAPNALVACSAVLDKWEFRNNTVLEIARKVCEPYGISVSVQAGVEFAKAPPNLSIAPGDTGFEVILAAAKSSGVLAVSTPEGGVLLTQSGTTRAHDSLIEGGNFVAASGNFDASERFYRYIALAQTAGTDAAFGDATRLRAQAFDDGVKRQERTLILRPESGHSVAYNKAYADWEARIRAANGESARVFVRGWTQSDGSIWQKNTVTRVESKRLRINGEDRLISQVDFGNGPGGPMTTLRIVRTDAYESSPTARVKG